MLLSHCITHALILSEVCCTSLQKGGGIVTQQYIRYYRYWLSTYSVHTCTASTPGQPSSEALIFSLRLVLYYFNNCSYKLPSIKSLHYQTQISLQQLTDHICSVCMYVMHTYSIIRNFRKARLIKKISYFKTPAF